MISKPLGLKAFGKASNPREKQPKIHKGTLRPMGNCAENTEIRQELPKRTKIFTFRRFWHYSTFSGFGTTYIGAPNNFKELPDYDSQKEFRVKLTPDGTPI